MPNWLQYLKGAKARKALKHVKEGGELYRLTSKQHAFAPMGGHQYTSREPIGRYWALNKEDISPLVYGHPDEGDLKEIINSRAHMMRQREKHLTVNYGEGATTKAKDRYWKLLKGKLYNPNSQVKAFTPDEWKSYIKDTRSAREITDKLKQEGLDAVVIPDTAVGQSDRYQLVQLKQPLIKARLGRTTKLIGAVGAATGAYQLGEGDAEAMAGPIKKITQAAARAAKSSSTDRLIGKTVLGKTVVNVTKGKGKWRNVIYDTGEMQVMDTAEINSLCSAFGGKTYGGKYAASGDPLQKEEQLRKSLKYHYSRSPAKIGSTSYKTAGQLERETKEHVKRLKMIDPDVYNQDVVMVKTTDLGLKELSKELGPRKIGGHAIFPVPKEYAQDLESKGWATILKKNTERVNK